MNLRAVPSRIKNIKHNLVCTSHKFFCDILHGVRLKIFPDIHDEKYRIKPTNQPTPPPLLKNATFGLFFLKKLIFGPFLAPKIFETRIFASVTNMITADLLNSDPIH